MVQHSRRPCRVSSILRIELAQASPERDRQDSEKLTLCALISLSCLSATIVRAANSSSRWFTIANAHAMRAAFSSLGLLSSYGVFRSGPECQRSIDRRCKCPCSVLQYFANRARPAVSPLLSPKLVHSCDLSSCSGCCDALSRAAMGLSSRYALHIFRTCSRRPQPPVLTTTITTTTTTKQGESNETRESPGEENKQNNKKKKAQKQQTSKTKWL